VRGAFDQLQVARRALEWEVDELLSPGDEEIGRMLTLTGYTYLAFAENWCSGVPLDDPDVGLSTAELLSLAETRFTQARSGPISDDFEKAALVGRARARLGLGDFTGAAADAAQVPTGWVLNSVHSTATGEGNGIFLLNTVNERLTLSDIEGGNGLPFRSAGDPRVPWTRTAYLGEEDVGQNTITPQYDLLKYPSVDSPVPLATGTEARLIQAEWRIVEYFDFAGAVSLMNGLRADIGLSALPTTPGTYPEAVDLLFQERAFWLFATGHRLGDLRRLINYYGRSASTILPAGVYPLPNGGTYGTDANLPVPTSARGSGFSGCTVRGG